MPYVVMTPKKMAATLKSTQITHEMVATLKVRKLQIQNVGVHAILLE